jgi:hypothetical protein
LDAFERVGSDRIDARLVNDLAAEDFRIEQRLPRALPHSLQRGAKEIKRLSLENLSPLVANCARVLTVT